MSWIFVLILMSLNTLSHSSTIKYLSLSNFSYPYESKSKIRPGVPTMICGAFILNSFLLSSIGTPPKKTPTLYGKNFPNLLNSSFIWYANSRV